MMRAQFANGSSEDSPNDPFVDVAGKAIIGNAAQDKLMVFKIDTPTNEPGRQTDFRSRELTVQHAFGDLVLASLATTPWFSTVIPDYDNFLLRDQPALVGLSDTANAVLFYENYGFQARIAYNWRDEFLNSRGQDTGANPKYTEAYSQVDSVHQLRIADGAGHDVVCRSVKSDR